MANVIDTKRQAIVTKYLCPTNFRDSRVKAKAYAGSKTYNWKAELNVDENHDRAAMEFAKEKGWLDKNYLVGGSLPDNTGNCYVMVEKEKIMDIQKIIKALEVSNQWIGKYCADQGHNHHIAEKHLKEIENLIGKLKKNKRNKNERL